MWKKIIVCAVSAFGAATAADYRVEQREPVHHVFSKDAGLDVDNVNGFVAIIGDSPTNIRVEGEKIIRGADQGEVDRGKREVTLDIGETGGVARLLVNGPFRNNGHGYQERSNQHYTVTYNLTIHVPQATALTLRTVNGEVKSDNTSGRFEIHAVNGAITLNNIEGSGRVETVNGAVEAGFRQNPAADISFKSVNGRIHVTFQPNLSGELKLRTVNGKASTDFETAAAPQPKTSGFPFGMNQSRSFKVGSGGPELAFETVNGEIRIQKPGR